MDKKSNFIEVCHQNFVDDFAILNIEKINKLIKSSLSPLIADAQLNESLFSSLREDFSTIAVYLSVYEQLVTHWIAYSTDCHIKSCKFLSILLFIFSEFKVKGLKVPQELQDETDANEDQKRSNKFETDDQDAAGLGDGDGVKDVSDQIENEDQLDDAKKQETRDEENKEKPDEKPIKEEEKGIEMSEDFDGVLDDVQMEDHDEERKDDEDERRDEEEDEELDDQKGDVDNANNALDEQLWNDDEDEPDEADEEDEEKNLEDKIEGGESMKDQESELVSKENLPVSKKDKKNNQDDTAAKEQDGEDDETNDNEENADDDIMNQDNFNEDIESQTDKVNKK